MSDRVTPGPVQDDCTIREAVCIHTGKIYDSCRDKDCIEDIRVYPTRGSQEVIDRALSVRSGRAELLRAYIDVEPASYNRGFYSVDIRYFYRITAEAFVGTGRPAEVSGLAVFSKRVVLFGSEGTAKTFSSRTCAGEDCRGFGRAGLPEAVVEAVDPIVLGLKLMDPCDCGCICGGAGPAAGTCTGENELTDLPPDISTCFDCDLSFENGIRRLYVTLGQFSIVRLQRDTQLLIPMYDYCMPTRECVSGEEECEDDPCEIFRQIRFPVGDFFPPSTLPGMEENREDGGCKCR